MRSVREETYTLLRALGLSTIFGNPGSTELAFLDDFPKDFRYILSLHEGAAVAMADGYAQATRQPALVNVHTAPGLGNAMGNIVAAHANKTPLIITAGQQVRAMLLLEPWLCNRDATELPKPYVKWSYEPLRAQDVPAALARAWYIAQQQPAGPVFVSIPKDDWLAPAEPYLPRTVAHRTAPDPVALRDLVASLQASTAPALVVGAGVDRSGGWSAGIALAERLSAAVWAAPASGRASFPETHPLFQGFLPLAQARIAETLAPYDLVLVLGAPIFSYYPYVPGPVVVDGTTLIQITDDPDEAARAPAGTSIVGNIGLAIQQLTGLLNSSASSARHHMNQDAGSVASLSSGRASPMQPNASTPMSPAFVLHTLAQMLPPNVVIFEETPSNVVDLQRYIPITHSSGYYSAASGGLGWAMPAAIGVQLAQPDRRAVCILGDGSSMYAIQALWTAARHALPIICVVLNNQQYAILKAFAQFEGISGALPGLDLPGIDVVSIAQGFGCEARRVVTPTMLVEAFAWAFHRTGPALIDVQIDPTIPPLL